MCSRFLLKIKLGLLFLFFSHFVLFFFQRPSKMARRRRPSLRVPIQPGAPGRVKRPRDGLHCSMLQRCHPPTSHPRAWPFTPPPHSTKSQDQTLATNKRASISSQSIKQTCFASDSISCLGQSSVSLRSDPSENSASRKDKSQ